MRWRWRIAWLLTYPWARFLLPLRVEGREALLPGAQIIAVNHTSNFDPLIVGWAAGREIYFLAKEELFRHRAFAWLIRSWNALPVGRGGVDKRAIGLCSQLLCQGQTLVLFPEGTRSRDGRVGEFKPGVALLAVRNRVPVVPGFISGLSRSRLSYWVDRDFVRLGLRSKPEGCVPIRVRFGQPLFPEGFPANRQGYLNFTALLRERVAALGSQGEV